MALPSRKKKKVLLRVRWIAKAERIDIPHFSFTHLQQVMNFYFAIMSVCVCGKVGVAYKAKVVKSLNRNLGIQMVLPR